MASGVTKTEKEPASGATLDMQKQILDLQIGMAAYKKSLRAHGRRLTAITDMVGSLYADKLANVTYDTPQEKAWAGQHGFLYVLAHLEENWKGTRVKYWQMILDIIPDIKSVCEFGCNIGANLKAINYLNPAMQLTGIEINKVACDVISSTGIADVHNGSIINVDLKKQFDLVFSRGVLIHLNQGELAKTLENMGRHSSRYVMVYEIYSDELHHLDNYSTKVTGGQQGEGYQFWRDFSAEFAKLHPDWKPVRSGVASIPDAKPKHGDIAWTIFKRPDAK
jgi:pseudaminic acid biosynthesis-associated methylase